MIGITVTQNTQGRQRYRHSQLKDAKLHLYKYGGLTDVAFLAKQIMINQCDSMTRIK